MIKPDFFDLSGKTALITGASGLLGPKHAEALLECGANVILTDIDANSLQKVHNSFIAKYENKVKSYFLNVVQKESIQKVFNEFSEIDILINNAAKDPKVKKDDSLGIETRFETMSEEYWKEGLDAIINGTFLCTQAFCNHLLKRNAKGVVINIASDLSVIAPDQRIYRKEGLEEKKQNVKPITYSAAKWAVVGMTKYLAVYFAEKGIRVNCLSPTGVFNNHPDHFVEKLSNIIPMGRMAHIDEYKGAIIFLASDASSYMTGHNLIIDGGKTVW